MKIKIEKQCKLNRKLNLEEEVSALQSVKKIRRV